MVLSLSENDNYWTGIRDVTFKVRILDEGEVVEISNPTPPQAHNVFVACVVS
jgi:hypothetical protein